MIPIHILGGLKSIPHSSRTSVYTFIMEVTPPWTCCNISTGRPYNNVVYEHVSSSFIKFSTTLLLFTPQTFSILSTTEPDTKIHLASNTYKPTKTHTNTPSVLVQLFNGTCFQHTLLLQISCVPSKNRSLYLFYKPFSINSVLTCI